AALERFLERTDHWPVPLLVAVWPLASLRSAEFFANEVPGAVVPDAVVERMRRAEERGGAAAARDEGIAIAREMARAVRALGGSVRGIHVVTRSGDLDAALDVLAAVPA